MDPTSQSKWDLSKGKGCGPWMWLLGALVLVVVIGAGFVWLFNSTGFRIAREVYDGAKDVVTSANYYSSPEGDRLTITVARDVTRDEALRLQCQTVLPLLAREHTGARVVLIHPDGDFRLDGEPCPSAP